MATGRANNGGLMLFGMGSTEERVLKHLSNYKTEVSKSNSQTIKLKSHSHWTTTLPTLFLRQDPALSIHFCFIRHCTILRDFYFNKLYPLRCFIVPREMPKCLSDMEISPEGEVLKWKYLLKYKSRAGMK